MVNHLYLQVQNDKLERLQHYCQYVVRAVEPWTQQSYAFSAENAAWNYAYLCLY